MWLFKILLILCGNVAFAEGFIETYRSFEDVVSSTQDDFLRIRKSFLDDFGKDGVISKYEKMVKELKVIHLWNLTNLWCLQYVCFFLERDHASEAMMMLSFWQYDAKSCAPW